MNQQELSEIYKIGGLEKLLKAIKLISKTNYLIRKILELDSNYFVLQKFTKDFITLEKEIKKYGIKTQAQKFINKMKINPAVYSDITNKNIENEKGLLIYGLNHNAGIEPIILFYILNQKRTRLILFRMFHFLGKNVKRYSFPVVARNYHDGGLFRFIKFYDFSKRFRDSENMTDDQIIDMNEKSIRNASRTLENGGNVIIFPGGGGDELKKWGFGISRIIMSISKDKRNNVSLLPVYFSGMGGKRMLIRLMRAYKKDNQNTLRVGVYFGKKKSITEMFNVMGNKITEEKLLKYIRKDSFKQYGLKEFPFKLYLYPKYYPLAISKGAYFFIKIFLQILPFKDFFKAV